MTARLDRHLTAADAIKGVAMPSLAMFIQTEFRIACKVNSPACELTGHIIDALDPVKALEDLGWRVLRRDGASVPACPSCAMVEASK